MSEENVENIPIEELNADQALELVRRLFRRLVDIQEGLDEDLGRNGLILSFTIEDDESVRSHEAIRGDSSLTSLQMDCLEFAKFQMMGKNKSTSTQRKKQNEDE